MQGMGARETRHGPRRRNTDFADGNGLQISSVRTIVDRMGTDDEDAAPTTLRPRRRRFWGFLLLVLLAALGALGYLYWRYRRSLDEALAAELESIRRAGYPVTLAELDRWYATPPPGENAADIYIKAFDKYDPNNGSSAIEDPNLPVIGSAQLPRRSAPLPREMLQAIEAYLDKNREALDLLKRAPTKTRARYPIDLTRGPAVELPHLAPLKLGAMLLQLAALRDVEISQCERALDGCHASIRLAGSLLDEPDLFSQLVRLRCLDTSVASLERVLCRCGVPDRQLAGLMSELHDTEAPKSMLRAFAGVLCNVNDAFDRLGSIHKDRPQHLKIMQDYIKACTKPFPERLTDRSGVEQQIKRLPTYYEIPWIPSIGHSLVLEGETVARLRAARAALAVERFRNATGKLPDRLSELVSTYLDEIPADPFDGKPLRFKRPATGYVIYSVGEDGTDDGGAEPKEDEGAKDVTFTVER